MKEGIKKAQFQLHFYCKGPNETENHPYKKMIKNGKKKRCFLFSYVYCYITSCIGNI